MAAKVMGIVNLSPDSFSDGAQSLGTSAALRKCERLLENGAHILDIGAESSRPGAVPVCAKAELSLLLPVVREAVKLGIPISIDTCKAEVMEVVLAEGVDVINDIWALRQPGSLTVVGQHLDCGVVLMHMHREPQTMQIVTMQGDVPSQVFNFLQVQSKLAMAGGVARDRICLDPGIGFGKTVDQNFAILSRQEELLALQFPVLCGWSRKSSLGAATGLDVGQRMVPSVVAAALSVLNGARIVRAHDVAETLAAINIVNAII